MACFAGVPAGVATSAELLFQKCSGNVKLLFWRRLSTFPSLLVGVGGHLRRRVVPKMFRKCSKASSPRLPRPPAAEALPKESYLLRLFFGRFCRPPACHFAKRRPLLLPPARRFLLSCMLGVDAGAIFFVSLQFF